MKTVRFLLLLLAALFAFTFGPSASYGADSASFNPVSVAAKAQSGGVPVGSIMAWPVAQSPPDAASWLECNGQSTAGYPELATIFGANTPDLRGKFLRGLGGSSAGLGVTQGDAIRNIKGDIGEVRSGGIWTTTGPFGPAFGPASGIIGGFDTGDYSTIHMSFDASRVVPTANENRPVNMAVRYLIRARP